MNKAAKLWILFKTTFLISMTTNTGYAILSVMKSNFVKKHQWFSQEEMADYIALAQSTPGPMAINASMIIGYQTAGILGSLSAVLGCALPPLLVMILVSFFYNRINQNTHIVLFMKGMQYGVAAMLLDVLIGLIMNVTRKEIAYPAILIVLSFVYVKFAGSSIFYLAVICLLVSALKVCLIKRKIKESDQC